MLDQHEDMLDSQHNNSQLNSNPYNLNNFFVQYNGNETFQMSTNDTLINSFNKSNIFEQLGKIGDGTQNFKSLNYNSFIKSFNSLSTAENFTNKAKQTTKKKLKNETLFVFDEDNAVDKEDIFNDKSSQSKKVTKKPNVGMRRKQKKKVKNLFHYPKIKYTNL